MALTGIQILKMLPKKNCGECGIPTCLAFAMKVAAGQAEVETCPYVSDEAKATIGEASAPPIRTIKIGSGDAEFVSGGETCLFRHEKRFEHPTGIAILMKTDEDAAVLDGKIERFDKMVYERVGVYMRANLVAIKDCGDAGAFKALTEKVVEKLPSAAIILMSDNIDALKDAAAACGDRTPLLYGATAENYEAFADLARELHAPVGVKGRHLDDLVEVAGKLLDGGVKDMIIDTGARTMRGCFEDNVVAAGPRSRRSSSRLAFRPLPSPAR
jgi:acetyl-CoA decarbonylase/synthase complex subunit gamma